MKNIHILPTDSPSKLTYSKVKHDSVITYKLIFNKVYSKCNNGLLSGQRHIYITTEDEIKIGDYIIKDDRVVKANYNGNELNPLWKKIIMTTDQKLIADGIQSIDDEFLEWFVKNPTYEFVEVENYYNPKNMVYGINTNAYKIIIPQEESTTKQEPIDFHSIDKKLTNYDNPLTEAAKKYAKDKTDLYQFQCTHYTDFIVGAKWQAEQHVQKIDKMYSKEEVEHLIHLAVFQSHCGITDRVKTPNSNECAHFVNKWMKKNIKK